MLYSEEKIDNKQHFLHLLVLVYVPSVTMVVSYSLLYYQLEKMTVACKISTGIAYRSRFQNQKCEKCIKITAIVVILLYVLVQTTGIVFIYYGWITLDLFGTESGAGLAFIFLALNAN